MLNDQESTRRLAEKLLEQKKRRPRNADLEVQHVLFGNWLLQQAHQETVCAGTDLGGGGPPTSSRPHTCIPSAA